MARDTTDDTPLTSIEDMAAYMAEGCKPKETFRIGTEHEKFGFSPLISRPFPISAKPAFQRY